MGQVLEPAFRKPFVNVTRWFTTVVNQPKVKEVLGQVTLCAKMAEFDAKKFAEFSGKGDGKKEKKEKAPKQEQKKPEKKKEEKKKEAEPEADIPAEPKKADPFEKMPKGTFDLEEWKRFYSNNDEPESVKWFWEHLTMKTTPSGEEITNTMMNSPWSSCPVTSSVECSRGWTNLTKMLLLQYVCLDRTMTVPSLESGCLRVMNSHLSWMTIGRLTTLAITGRSLIASQVKPKSW